VYHHLYSYMELQASEQSLLPFSVFMYTCFMTFVHRYCEGTSGP
jgi:hypothetical protein